MLINWSYYHVSLLFFSLLILPYRAWNSKAVTIWNHLFAYFVNKFLCLHLQFIILESCALYVLFLFWAKRVEFFWSDFSKEIPPGTHYSGLYFPTPSCRSAHNQNVLVLAALARAISWKATAIFRSTRGW